MKRWVKWTLGIIGCLVILIILALVLITSLINPNDYKGRIEAAVHEKTGLYLNIGGDIKWQLFPSIGLAVSHIKVEDQQKQPLATLQQAQLSLKLIPLLFKKVDMDKVIVNGVDLNIVKMVNGKFNWQQSSASQQENATQEKAAHKSQEKETIPAKTNLANNTTSAPTKTSTPLAFNVQKIELKKINLHYQDKISHQDLYVHNAYMTAGNILSGNTFPLNAGFTVKSKNPSLDMSFVLTSNGRINLQKHTYALSDMQLKVTPLQPSAKGDSFTLQGSASMAGKAITFNFNGSQLNLQNYLPIAASNVAASNTVASNTGNTRTSKNNVTPSSSGQTHQVSHKDKTTPANTGNEVIIPVGPIQSLDINGSLKLAGLTFNTLTFNHPEIAIKADRGIAQLSRLHAGFYDGTIDAKAVVNARYSTPNISVNATIVNTNLQKLLHAVKGIDNIQGSVNASVRLLTQGTTQNELTNSLNGRVGFHIDKGQITGLNVNHLVCQMIASIRNKKIKKKDWADSTQFTALKGEWNIHDGVARNNDLTASLNQMNLRGDGWVNLLTQMMDYHLGLTITGSGAISGEPACEINPKYADITWPIQCKGKIGQKGLCGIDTKRLGDTAKALLQREAEEQLQKQLKKHLGNEIGNKLKGLFN